MGELKDRIRHAFAVDPPGPAEPKPDEQPAVDWICTQVAKRHLTTPGLIMLEVSRPMNFIAAQAMHMLQPAVWAMARQANTEHYEAFARFLERRGSIEYLAARIEHFEHEFRRREEGTEGS